MSVAKLPTSNYGPVALPRRDVRHCQRTHGSCRRQTAVSVKSRKELGGAAGVVIPTGEHRDEAPRGFSPPARRYPFIFPLSSTAP